MDANRWGAPSARCRLVLALLVLAALLVATGCSEAEAPVNPMMDAGGDPDVQICRYCSETALPDSDGATEIVGGEQIARISIEEGSFVPNRINASAGTPITLEFTPAQPAKGCIAMPTIEALDKQGSATTETGVMELGIVEPGEYPITCGMGSPAGVLIVE
jgi:plastocyanin